MTVVSAVISDQPKSWFDPMPSVTVTFEDGTEKKLFTYYPDEISFTAKEFIGLTEAQCFELRHNKDVQYIRS